MKRIYSQFNLGSLIVHYILDEDTHIMGLRILPARFDEDIPQHREDLSAQPENHFFRDWGGYPDSWNVEPLVLISLSGSERAGGFSQGQTMRNGKAAQNLNYQFQEKEIIDQKTIIKTVMQTPLGVQVKHYLTFHEETEYLRCHSEIINNSSEIIGLELLSSFTMGFISPFQTDDGPGKYKIHRFKSSWSSEGRHICENAEDLDLDSSWCNHGVNCERFGQLGSMPVRRWFPIVGIEDSEKGITWGAHIEAPGSWQMEIYRKDDFFHLSGGQADRDFGHWIKNLSPGDSFCSGKASITSVKGGIDKLCNVLISQQKQNRQHMTPVFNEWCTSWGKPSAEKLTPLLERVENMGARYFVIDAGWYADEGGRWEMSQGDWNISKDLFPYGLIEFCRTIRAKGLIPGIWFEPEVVGENANILKNRDWLVHRDEKPVKSGSRFFLDFRKEEVRDYLKSKLYQLIRECRIGYIKIDYNETIGPGCDGDDSPGEGLRKHLSEVQSFYRELQEEFPYLIIENCSSGGHRLEPSFINNSDISSFSDAHETKNIPIIAANLHNLITPSKSLVWAVVHPNDDTQRLYYSLAATFLGRICISGEIDKLSENQMSIISDAINFHSDASHIIVDGESHRFGESVTSYKDPHGWQALIRYSRKKNEVLIILHTFKDSPNEIFLPFDNLEEYRMIRELTCNKMIVEYQNDLLKFNKTSDFSGSVFLLKRRN